ncbi:hypothetical protein EWE75_21520 [Sphingomonas populi]|uniref:Uncharacterized protein n=1 Tax=Sphingomonas populi TaxID=2484750 RepID=A0A4Q6XKT7_9SPHN|nr:hypothetical protein [Sphingomonas populi]RZF60720.1 hypothetical protein EWE75_21520 [Sphingomonas populi]
MIGYGLLAANRSAILDDVVAASQSVYGRRSADEITRFFRTLVGQRYGGLYPQLISDVQARRYLTKAAAEPADQKAS